MKDFLDIFGMWLWLIFVSIIGGLLGLISRNDLTNLPFSKKLKALFLGVVTSMFVAYIVYELSLYIFNKEALSVAIAGLAAYMGTNALVALENALIAYIEKRVKR